MSLAVPSTYLDHLQRLTLEVGLSSLPTTAQNVTGETQRLAVWVAQAWERVGRKHEDWLFLRQSASWVTVAGQAQYTLAQCGISVPANFNLWKRDTFRNYVTASGTVSELEMLYEPDYDVWRNNYFLGALRNTKSRPYIVTVGPDKSVWLGPVPDVGYTITADYFVKVTPLVNDADTTPLPSDLAMIIVYAAMMDYGQYESAPEVYQRGKVGYDAMMTKLGQDWMPEVRAGATLA